MKKIISTLIIAFLFINFIQAQGLKGLLNKVTKKDSASGKSVWDKMSTGSTGKGLSNDDIISGL